MLVLSRKIGEEVVIDDVIKVKVSAINGGRVKLVIDAPKHMSVRRSTDEGQASGTGEKL